MGPRCCLPGSCDLVAGVPMTGAIGPAKRPFPRGIFGRTNAVPNRRPSADPSHLALSPHVSITSHLVTSLLQLCRDYLPVVPQGAPNCLLRTGLACHGTCSISISYSLLPGVTRVIERFAFGIFGRRRTPGHGQCERSSSLVFNELRVELQRPDESCSSSPNDPRRTARRFRSRTAATTQTVPTRCPTVNSFLK